MGVLSKFCARMTGLLAASLFATSLAAADSNWEQVVKDAKAEGSVTYYVASSPDAAARVSEAFKQKYGITVDIVRVASGPLGQRFAAEAEAGSVVADVIVIAQPAFLDLASSKGWIATVEGLPSLKNWPAANFDGKFALIGVNAVTVAWNGDLVSDADAPKSWEDLLDPKWKDKILFTDVRTVPAYMGWAKLIMDTYGAAFLQKLQAQNLHLVPSVQPGAQQLAAGEGALLFPANRQAIVPLQAAGAKLKDVVLSPATGSELKGGVAAAAPHPNAARLFLDFLMSPQGQSLFNDGGGASVLSNIPNAMELPKDYHSSNIPTGEAADAVARALGLN